MIFSEKSILSLRKDIANHLSDSRTRHTFGVQEMALEIGEACAPDKLDILSVSALLHDITKEYSVDEHLAIMKKSKKIFTDDDYLSIPVYHSFTAPEVIKSEYPNFAVNEVLSAVYNHTIGSPDMSITDEIIFISDYIEKGRTHPACSDLRKVLRDDLSMARDISESVMHLHKATIKALENTIIHLSKSGFFIHPTTVITRNSFLAKTPTMINKI